MYEVFQPLGPSLAPSASFFSRLVLFDSVTGIGIVRVFFIRHFRLPPSDVESDIEAVFVKPLLHNKLNDRESRSFPGLFEKMVIYNVIERRLEQRKLTGYTCHLEQKA